MIAWWGPVIWEYYAGTEGNGVTMVNSAQWLTHPGTVGKAVVGELKICDDETGAELPPGQSGTIYFANGRPFAYHNDAAKTASSTHPKGWTTLGDVGYVDAEGYLYLTDRKAYMIISGGVNIYPQEAENVLINHPQVADVAVLGVPNEEFGEEVKAVVQPRDMRDAGPELEAALIAYCRAHLSPIKCPRSVDFEAELPEPYYQGVHSLFPNTTFTVGRLVGIGNREPFIAFYRIFPGDSVGEAVAHGSIYLPRGGDPATIPDLEKAHASIMQVVSGEDFVIAADSWKRLASAPPGYRLTFGRNEMLLQQNHRLIADLIGMPIVS